MQTFPHFLDLSTLLKETPQIIFSCFIKRLKQPTVHWSTEAGAEASVETRSSEECDQTKRNNNQQQQGEAAKSTWKSKQKFRITCKFRREGFGQVSLSVILDFDFNLCWRTTARRRTNWERKNRSRNGWKVKASLPSRKFSDCMVSQSVKRRKKQRTKMQSSERRCKARRKIEKRDLTVFASWKAWNQSQICTAFVVLMQIDETTVKELLAFWKLYSEKKANTETLQIVQGFVCFSEQFADVFTSCFAVICLPFSFLCFLPVAAMWMLSLLQIIKLPYSKISTANCVPLIHLKSFF